MATMFTFTPRPEDSEDWRAAGFVPAERIDGTLPKDLLPDVASIEVVHRRSDHVVLITLAADDLTPDDGIGVHLARQRHHRPVITREEARAAFLEWVARGRKARS